MTGAVAASETAGERFLEGSGHPFVAVEANDPWAPEEFAKPLIVPAVFVAVAPVVDGLDDDSAWRGADGVEVPLEWGRVSDATVKAVYTEEEIFLSVSWADATKDDQHRPWIWDAASASYVESPQAEDALLVSVEGGCDWNPSLLAGLGFDFDAWLWLAARTDPLGQAVDADGNVKNRPKPARMGFEKYPSRHQDLVWDVKFMDRRKDILTLPWRELERRYNRSMPVQEIYVRYRPDGRPTPAFVERVEAPAIESPVQEGASGGTLIKTGSGALPPTVLQYRPLELSGDAGDVAAKGHWADGRWTVEFRRARVTGSRTQTDSVFERTTQLSLHVFDGTERLDESSESPRLLIQFEPRATTTVRVDPASLSP